jgi:hypothetical protein
MRRCPLPSPGSLGSVPLAQGYYGTLRLPAAHLAALRCLHLAIPPLRPICSHRPGRAAGGTGSWYSGSRAGNVGGNGRVSQVPERPSCPCALLLDPGRTDTRQAVAASRRGPRLCQPRWLPQQRRFRGSIARHWDSLSTLRREGHPSTTQDSLPAAGQALPGGIRSPAGLQ